MNAIKKEISAKETVDVLENVIFTNIVEDQLKSTPLSEHIDIIGFIACEYDLNMVVSKTSMVGSLHAFKTAKKILVNSIKNN